MRTRRTFRVLAGLMALTMAATAAACGDDEDDAATPTTRSADQPTGDPIKIAFIHDSGAPGQGTYPERLPTMLAHAAAVNADGGIDGRPLEVEECLVKGSPDLARECATEAAADPEVVAAVTTTVMGSIVDPILLEAGIANVVAFPIGIEDFTTANTFPINGGVITANTGAAIALVDFAEAKKLNLVYPDIPAGAQIVDLVNGVLAVRYGDVQLSGTTPIPPTATDMTPHVTAASSDADGIVLVLATAPATSFVRTMRQLGADTELGSARVGALDEVARDDLGSAVDGVFLSDMAMPINADVPGIQEYRSEVEAAGGDTPLSSWGVLVWLSTRMIADVAAEQDAVTRQSVLDGLGSLENYDSGGIIPPYSTTTPFDGLGGTVPRLFNPTVVIEQVADGEPVVVEGGEFVNPFDPAR